MKSSLNHVTDYYKELDIKSNITKNHLINNQISLLMKKQYDNIHTQMGKHKYVFKKASFYEKILKL